MAKSLLRHWDYACDPRELGAARDGECVMENIVRSIVNAQNAQIQTMRDLLVSYRWPEFDDCNVTMEEGAGRKLTGGSAGRAAVGRRDAALPVAQGGGRTFRRRRTARMRRGKAAKRPKRPKTYPNTVVDGICRGYCVVQEDGREVCTFTVGVDLFSSDLAMFYFEECGGSDNLFPAIGIEAGKTYKFIQEDRSNYYHPLGFAYHPGGSHEGEELVEESFLTYRVDRNEIGLDNYKAEFFHSPGEWTSYGTYSVELEYNKDHHADLFYFSHIHKNMAGRIKLLNDGTPVHPDDFPAIDYTHPEPSPFDASCGTFGLSPFQLPHAECPSKFVCDKQSHFGRCVDAMNCFMMAGMTTYAEEHGDVALFKHHMIPHHKVNPLCSHFCHRYAPFCG